ncbi:MAG: GTPase Era [Bacteroidales bacterium]|nr:GTPase Era [Bacteroidota bacterium]MBL6950289.1 GTPase Era [Bacteroidales bacterium]
MTHKAGFVSIIGYPNVGKSTLMNALVGERLSIITPKAQTTRHRIMGILSGDDFQIVYSDTPGIIKPHYLLHRSMMAAVLSSLSDADAIVLVTEIDTPFDNEQILKKLKEHNTPIIMVINKVDISSEEIVKQAMEKWQSLFPDSDVIPVSALHKFNLGRLLDLIIDKLPDNPEYYPKDELSDRSERFFVSEMIREKIFLLFGEEIPYSCEVIVDSFKEDEKITRIEATIYVSRDSQKAIILGKQGKAIKKLGMAARKEIEAFLDQHIFLGLTVKVEKNWRENEHLLKRFGYTTNSDKS